MNMLKNILLFAGFLMVSCAGAVWADIGINATPSAGGSNVDFGVVESGQDVTENAHVAMTYTGSSVPYVVYYEVTTPFTNPSGTVLAAGAITFHTIVGSNQHGVLSHTTEGNLQSGQIQLYASGPTPQNDSFNIAYTAHGSVANASGLFHGVIKYKILSVDGTLQATDYLDFYVDFDLNLNVTVTGSTSSDLVHMIYPEGSNPPQYSFEIYFDGNTTGQQVKVTQDFQTLPQSGSGQYLTTGAVKYHTANAVNGTGNYPNPTLLTVAPQLIYTSTASTGSVKAVFAFDPNYIGGQTAGTYSTTITYKVEWAGDVYLFDVQFEVEVLPLFELVVTPGPNVQMNGNAFVLGQDLTALSGNKDIPIMVNVNTNMGQPYKVTYAMPVGLTHQVTGQTLVPNNVTASNNLQLFKWEKLTGQGNVVYAAYTTAVKGTFAAPVNVFTSNSTGVSAGLRVTYRLALASATQGIRGGDYRAPFVLTLMLN